MELNTLIHKAAAGYPDGLLLVYWDGRQPIHKRDGGDTLAEFIVRELAETFDGAADTPAQIAEAVRVLRKAQADLAGIITKLVTAEKDPVSDLMAHAMALHHQLFVCDENDTASLIEYDAALADLEQLGYHAVTTLAFERDEPDEET
jgi:hypothetical protein